MTRPNTWLGNRLGIGVAVAVVAALVATLVTTFHQSTPLRISADFTDTTGLYVGNDVRTLGVTIGKVTAIAPSGSSVHVTIELPEGTEIPADADAVIMQSSLVTDRFVELTPAYGSGELMPDGAAIPLARTKAPANIDDITSAVDELVVALDQPVAGRHGLGDLLDVSARALRGKGRKIHDALLAGQDALSTVSGNSADLTRITTNLNSLVGALARRDGLIRRLAGNVTTTSSIMAGQREALRQLVGELASVTVTVDHFLRHNRGVLEKALGNSQQVLATLSARQREMSEVLDLLPLVAQNIWKTYDPSTRRLRIRVDTRNTGPFSGTARNELCRALQIPDCDRLSNGNGTGLLDPFIEAMSNTVLDVVEGVTSP